MKAPSHQSVRGVIQSKLSLARMWQDLLLVLGCALLLAAIISSYAQYSQSTDAINQLYLQQQKVSQIDRLWIMILQAESDVRGYLITENQSYIDDYGRAVAEIDTLRATLIATMRKNGISEEALVKFADKLDKRLKMLQLDIEIGNFEPEAMPNLGILERTITNDIQETLEKWKLVGESVKIETVNGAQAYLSASRWISLTLGVGTILLMISLAVIVQKQLTMRDKMSHELELERQHLETEVGRRTEQLSRMAKYLTMIREEEKAQLARDLHDEMGALLTAAKMDGNWIVHNLDRKPLEEIRNRSERLLMQLDKAMSVKRRIIDDLRPPLLQELGLVASLETMAEESEASSEEHIVLSAAIERSKLTFAQELAFFRIAQESITNIRKYARAKTIRLILREDHSWVVLRVEDDGVGFDLTTLNQSKKHGINGMRFRIESLGGSFNISSVRTRGTVIEARLPLAS